MNPAAQAALRLETAFRSIAVERMAGVPILNHALQVEAVGMQAWCGNWLCALVTPWFINVVLLPRDGLSEAWAALIEGETVRHALPGGSFAFIAGSEPELGRFQICSLFSPVLEFADHETAIATALAALNEIMSQIGPDTDKEQDSWQQILIPASVREPEPACEESDDEALQVTRRGLFRRALAHAENAT